MLMHGKIESWNPAGQTGVIVADEGGRLMLHLADWHHESGHMPQTGMSVAFDALADRARNVRPTVAPATPMSTAPMPSPQPCFLARKFEKIGFYCGFVFVFFYSCVLLIDLYDVQHLFSDEGAAWFNSIFYAGWVVPLYLKLICAIAALAASGGTVGRSGLKVCATFFAMMVAANSFRALFSYMNLIDLPRRNLVWLFWFCFCIYACRRAKHVGPANFQLAAASVIDAPSTSSMPHILSASEKEKSKLIFWNVFGILAALFMAILCFLY